ncbi:TPA: hydroxymethylglutaryl-CoA reductase, degradative [Candidatus Micrarchaeota archaeon]|nr:hydroxymethylglutaryl-CoA reductase, degradative [Candidatus Micrarchaeota archaeon]
MASSELKGFYKKSLDERLAALNGFAGLSESEIALLKKYGALDFETANRMIENVYSTHALPLGVATNFKINGKDYLVPFALEEPSVVAAASNAAKLCRENGGFIAVADSPVMIGEIQLVGALKPDDAVKKIHAAKQELMDFAKTKDSTLIKLGGGPVELSAKVLDTDRGKMIAVYLEVNVLDAMGANAVNTMCEALAPKLEELSGGKARLRIISNLATKRLARAKAVWTRKALEESFKGEISGAEVVEAILDCYAFACADIYRAATHNKGIMNGVDAVVIATGNDWRAVEAGAHAYASLSGKYLPLTKYSKDAKGNLVGEIELPIAVGIIGGATKIHPLAQVALKILGVKSARELAGVIASVGLAQNFAALRALATTGIQKGHMSLHAKTLAASAGAKGAMIDAIAERMVKEKAVSFSRAQELFKELKC